MVCWLCLSISVFIGFCIIKYKIKWTIYQNLKILHCIKISTFVDYFSRKCVNFSRKCVNGHARDKGNSVIRLISLII